MMSKKPYVRLDKNAAAVLLVDHQAGLLSLVRDIDPDRFKNNVLALGDLAKYFKLTTILTTSFGTGPNGPLAPEQAGAQLMTWFGVACELHRDWRNDIEGLASLFSDHIPDYRNLITSHDALTAKK
jgi:nicotinamidase-related amidase